MNRFSTNFPGREPLDTPPPPSIVYVTVLIHTTVKCKKITTLAQKAISKRQLTVTQTCASPPPLPLFLVLRVSNFQVDGLHPPPLEKKF